MLGKTEKLILVLFKGLKVIHCILSLVVACTNMHRSVKQLMDPIVPLFHCSTRWMSTLLKSHNVRNNI